MQQTISFLEKLILPLVIAGVGWYASNRIAEAELKSAEKVANAQITTTKELVDKELIAQGKQYESDKNIKLLGVFIEHIMGNDQSKREIALEALTKLVPEIGITMVNAVGTNDSESGAGKKANEIKNDISNLININIQTSSHRNASTDDLIELSFLDDNNKAIFTTALDPNSLIRSTATYLTISMEPKRQLEVSKIQFINNGSDCWYPSSINIEGTHINVSGLDKEWFIQNNEPEYWCIQNFNSKHGVYLSVPISQ